MNIRQIKENDLSQLAVLFDQYRIFYGKESDVDKGKVFLADRIKNKDSEIFIAENSDNVLAGFIQLYPIFSSTRLQRLWLLNDLYVAPEHRGSKIAVMLIDKVKEHVLTTNSCGLILETQKENIIGNNLYKRTGFKLDEEHNYYSWNL